MKNLISKASQILSLKVYEIVEQPMNDKRGKDIFDQIMFYAVKEHNINNIKLDYSGDNSSLEVVCPGRSFTMPVIESHRQDAFLDEETANEIINRKNIAEQRRAKEQLEEVTQALAAFDQLIKISVEKSQKSSLAEELSDDVHCDKKSEKKGKRDEETKEEFVIAK